MSSEWGNFRGACSRGNSLHFVNNRDGQISSFRLHKRVIWKSNYAGRSLREGSRYAPSEFQPFSSGPLTRENLHLTACKLRGVCTPPLDKRLLYVYICCAMLHPSLMIQACVRSIRSGSDRFALGKWKRGKMRGSVGSIVTLPDLNVEVGPAPRNFICTA